MTDVMSSEKRSELMSRIQGTDTAPELALRRAIWRMGTRYRVHDEGVPGTPDLSHKGARVAVFVDGCFWHGCPDHYTKPDNNRAFWEEKIGRNKERDQEVDAQLEADGWRVFRFWEHEVKEGVMECARKVASAIEAGRSD